MNGTTTTNIKYVCPRCFKCYKYNRSLTRHLHYECGVQRQFACNICTKRFAQHVGLIRHKKICEKTRKKIF